MGLIETKFQLQRQIREAQALVGSIQYSQNTMRYYLPYDADVSTSDLETGIGYLQLAITNLQKHVTLLEQSESYKKEYGERYAVYQEPELRTKTGTNLES
jgi:hypothetical protein